MRALLRQAARGDRQAYVALAAEYFDLISEHLYLCNFDRADSLQKAESLLRDAWRHLPYLKRLSDWERFLAARLMEVEVGSTYSREGRRPQALVELESEAKFALIAFDLEKWSYHWLSLALRVPPVELRETLFKARCKLLNLDLSTASRKTRRCLERISADLDGQLTDLQRRQVLQNVCSDEAAKNFKSHWLDYRCHLIEMRQQIRFETHERDAFLESVVKDLSLEGMLRPSILTRLRNLFSFQQLPSPKMIPAGRDLRYGAEG